jgi:hypothetical protein
MRSWQPQLLERPSVLFRGSSAERIGPLGLNSHKARTIRVSMTMAIPDPTSHDGAF